LKNLKDSNAIVLRNLGNIPSRFSWEDIIVLDEFECMFEPKEGIIAPKTDIHIKVRFTPKVGGKFTKYLICNVDTLALPLGLEMNFEVFGLEVSYFQMIEVLPKSTNMM
jgi:hypothetical protein